MTFLLASKGRLFDTILIVNGAAPTSSDSESSIPTPAAGWTVVQLFIGSEGGGIMTAVSQWAPPLIDAGWPIEFVVLQEGKAAEMLRRRGLTPRIIPLGRLGRYTMLASRLRPYGSIILHAHNPSSHLIALRAARSLKARVVRTVHADLFEEMRTTQSRWRVGMWAWLMRRAMRRADALTVVSPHLTELLPGVRSSGRHVDVIANGFDPRAITKDDTPLPEEIAQWLDDGPLVLAMGRLTPVKNYAMLLHGWQEIHRRHPNARLILAGSGPLESKLGTLAEELQLGESFRLLSWIDAVAPFVRRASAVAITSRSECCPMLVFEAMSAGVPVVSTAVGGVPWLLEDGENGVLVESGDAKAFATAVNDLLACPKKATDLGHAGRATLGSRFTPAIAATATADVFCRVCR